MACAPIPLGLELGRGVRAALRDKLADDNPGSLATEVLGDAQADTLTCTGYNGDSIFE